MNALLRSAMVIAGAAVFLTLQAACARSVTSDTDSDPSFLSPDAMTPAPLTVCVSTECPPPWATCGDSGLCAVDTRRDIENCGACGNACPHQPPSHHATSVCAQGKCEMACDELSADCNHIAADGCEVDTSEDPKNCGGCGVTCKDGDVCWKGACGCPNGFTQCEQECKNLQVDMMNCGECGKKCGPPASWSDPAYICGPGIEPNNTTWSCGGGACKLSCKGNFGDCNADFCADGCEVDERTDPLNCGGCGVKCGAGQDCVDGTCLCPPGTTRCGSRCIDTNVDPDNCGGCGLGCPGAQDDTANGSPTCTGGRCGYICYVGFADCDHRIDNGCEANIGTDPKNCGGCGTKCDSARGQPCVEGKCLTKPCGPAPGTF